MSLDQVVCLCPTYGRPRRLLENTIACFEAQDYPLSLRRLIIYDDLGNVRPQTGPSWEIVSTGKRHRTLPDKYNALLRMAGKCDVVVVWEDDDIYLPWHISAHVAALGGPSQTDWSHPHQVWTTVSDLQLEIAEHRFHAALAFRAKFLRNIGGWPDTKQADFDQRLMGNALKQSAPSRPNDPRGPSYVFRWADTGAPHGQASMKSPDDEIWYDRTVATAEPVDRLRPSFDAAAAAVLRRFPNTPWVPVLDGPDLVKSADSAISGGTFEGPVGKLDRGTAFRILCEFLSRPEPGAARDWLRRLTETADFTWVSFVGLAHEYRVASAVSHTLHEFELSDLLPKDAVAYFDGCAAHYRRQNEQVRDEAIEVAGILNRIDVMPVFLKGGAHLLAGLYPDPAMRVMADLDILVPAARIDDCVAVLCDNDITPTTSYLHPRAHHRQALWRSDLPVPVELHHQVLAHPNGDFLKAGEVLGTAVELRERDARFAVPSPSCAVIHNIAHAQLNDHNYIYGRIDLRGLLDLVLLSRAHGGELNWGEICARFARKRKRTALDYHLLCAIYFLGLEEAAPGSRNMLSQLLYRRALYQVRKPNVLGLSVRLLQPWTLLRRELSDSDLRHRFARNVSDADWWKRHLRMLGDR